VTRVILRKGKRIGKDSTLDWEARLGGIKIVGSSVTTVWNPSKVYAWRNTERFTGLSLEGRFTLGPIHGGTELTAIVTYNVPKAVAPLVHGVAIRRFLASAVDKALRNIIRSAANGE
jgi:hypothetical protein